MTRKHIRMLLYVKLSKFRPKIILAEINYALERPLCRVWGPDNSIKQSAFPVNWEMTGKRETL